MKSSSLFAFMILNLLISSTASHHHNHHHYLNSQHANNHRATNHHHHQENKYKILSLSQQQQQVLVPALGQEVSSLSTSTAHLCSLLPSHVSKQLKLCKLTGHSMNADEAVASGAQKALAECRNQFKSERWNCTHANGDHHLLTSELAQSLGNRESGFVHAIAAAGIVHSIATACSVGNLTDCACDKSRIGSIRQEENWKWGGCSNNIRYGMLFAKHLVELLDAVHQHSRLLASSASSGNSHHLQTYPNHRLLEKRSLSSKHREPNQLRGRHSSSSSQNLNQQEQEQESNLSQANSVSFCQRNHNISQAAHIQLIKSLLSENSLEKHQEFRLAMNMHNNKVGRMVSN